MAGVSRQCKVSGGADCAITAAGYIDCASSQDLHFIRGPLLAMGIRRISHRPIVRSPARPGMLMSGPSQGQIFVARGRAAMFPSSLDVTKYETSIRITFNQMGDALSILVVIPRPTATMTATAKSIIVLAAFQTTQVSRAVDSHCYNMLIMNVGNYYATLPIAPSSQDHVRAHTAASPLPQRTRSKAVKIEDIKLYSAYALSPKTNSGTQGHCGPITELCSPCTL